MTERLTRRGSHPMGPTGYWPAPTRLADPPQSPTTTVATVSDIDPEDEPSVDVDEFENVVRKVLGVKPGDEDPADDG